MPDSMWVCPACNSLNRLKSTKCYSCGTPGSADKADQIDVLEGGMIGRHPPRPPEAEVAAAEERGQVGPAKAATSAWRPRLRRKGSSDTAPVDPAPMGGQRPPSAPAKAPPPPPMTSMSVLPPLASAVPHPPRPAAEHKQARARGRRAPRGQRPGRGRERHATRRRVDLGSLGLTLLAVLAVVFFFALTFLGRS